MNHGDIKRCKRQLNYIIGQLTGAPRTDVATHVTAHNFGTEFQDRWTAWMADTLYQALVDYSVGEWVLAFRGLLQAKEYAGRLGGFPGSELQDICIALQNAVESKIRA